MKTISKADSEYTLYKDKFIKMKKIITEIYTTEIMLHINAMILKIYNPKITI